ELAFGRRRLCQALGFTHADEAVESAIEPRDAVERLARHRHRRERPLPIACPQRGDREKVRGRRRHHHAPSLFGPQPPLLARSSTANRSQPASSAEASSSNERTRSLETSRPPTRRRNRSDSSSSSMVAGFMTPLGLGAKTSPGSPILATTGARSSM